MRKVPRSDSSTLSGWSYRNMMHHDENIYSHAVGLYTDFIVKQDVNIYYGNYYQEAWNDAKYDNIRQGALYILTT